MIREETHLVVADNTGAKLAKCFRVMGQHKEFAHIGDVIRVSIREATPTGAVKKGQVLMILEAMKMENEIMCPRDGKVVSVAVTKGAIVEAGTLLCSIQ